MPVGKEGIFVPHENGSPSGQDLAACFYDALRRDVALKTIAAQETEIRVQGLAAKPYQRVSLFSNAAPVLRIMCSNGVAYAKAHLTVQ